MIRQELDKLLDWMIFICHVLAVVTLLVLFLA